MFKLWMIRVRGNTRIRIQYYVYSENNQLGENLRPHQIPSGKLKTLTHSIND